MTVTQVDLANMALDLVGAATILSLNDPTPEAGIVSRALPGTIQAVLRSYPWSCASRRATVNASPAANVLPTSCDQNRAMYALPTDCLRVIDVCAASWHVENASANADGVFAPVLMVSGSSSGSCSRADGTAITSDPVTIRYVADISDPNQLDPLVRELIAYELAIKVAAKITESPQRIAALTRKTIQARKMAQAVNARTSSQVSHSGGMEASSVWADAMAGV